MFAFLLVTVYHRGEAEVGHLMLHQEYNKVSTQEQRW